MGFKFVLNQVGYNIDGWLNKNKDPINESIVSLLGSSKEKLISALFHEEPGSAVTSHPSMHFVNVVSTCNTVFK